MALQPLRILNDHKHEVCSVAFSPDGTTFASGGGYRDNAVRLWDARTWEPRGVLKGHKGKVSRLAFARDGRTLASAGHDRTVRLWDARTGEMRKTLAGCRTLVFAVAFSPDGKTLATAGQDGRVILWDADADGTCRTLTEHAGSALSVAFSEDGGMLASAGGMERWRGEPAEVRLWNTGDWRLNHVVGGHGDWVLWAAFSPDGEILGSGSYGEVLLTDVRSGEVRRVIRKTDWSMVAFAFAPDSGLLASGGWRFVAGRDGEPDYRQAEGGVQLWDVRTGALRRTVAAHAREVTSLGFSPDGTLLVSGGRDGAVKLWDVAALLG